MIESLKKVQDSAHNEIPQATDTQQLQQLQVKYLGRKGLFADASALMGQVPAPQKKEAGRLLNEVKKDLETLFAEAQSRLEQSSQDQACAVDLSMPATYENTGSLHILTQVMMDITDIFKKLGFALVDGPEAETEHYNFEALNIPLNHPSRDGFDTFYLQNGKLLRSQTSTVQVRVMEKIKPPLKVIAPGKVFRPDATDATHSFMFHQIEGLAVDENLSFSDLKGVLFSFAKTFFGPDTKLRFRPHYFPFTEPSAEIDIYSPKRGWLEILGAGMVHPNVLKSVHIDAEKYTGFAFGMGVERIAMLKYGIEDIRVFFENDTRFLRQF